MDNANPHDISLYVVFAGTAINTLIGFFSSRTLTGIDKNQADLFDRLHVLERDFYTLQGSHESNHKGREV